MNLIERKYEILENFTNDLDAKKSNNFSGAISIINIPNLEIPNEYKDNINTHVSCIINTCLNVNKLEENKVALPLLKKSTQYNTNIPLNKQSLSKEIETEQDLNLSVDDNQMDEIPSQNESENKAKNNIFNLFERAKTGKIKNSDILFAIFSIKNIEHIFGKKAPPKSKIFWQKLFKLDEYKKIFLKFKQITIKKYYILISPLKFSEEGIYKLVSDNLQFVNAREVR